MRRRPSFVQIREDRPSQRSMQCQDPTALSSSASKIAFRPDRSIRWFGQSEVFDGRLEPSFFVRNAGGCRAADCQANRREDSSCRQRVHRLIKARTLSHPEDPHPPHKEDRPAAGFSKRSGQKDEGVALDERSFIACGKATTMDVTINVNLTPKEARELMALPDLQPLQDEALAEIRRRVMAQAENISADGLLKSWFMGSSSAFEIFRNMTDSMLSQNAGRVVSTAAGSEESRRG